MGENSVQLRVEPGIVFNRETTVDDAALNEAANPKVSLEEGAGIGPEHLDLDRVLAQLGDSLRGVNWISRPNFWASDWTADSVVGGPGVWTENAYDWYVHPDEASAEATFARVQAGPNQDSEWAARIIGATGNGSVRFANWLPPAIAGQLRAETLTFSVYVKNETSALAWFSPILYTAGVAGSRDSTDEAVTAPAISVEPGEWKRIVHTFDAGDFPNFRNGAFIGIETDELDTDLKSIIVAQAQLETSTVASTFKRPAIPPVPRDDSLPPCYEGEDKNTPAGIRLVMADGQERQLCPPHPGLTLPVLSWDRLKGHPLWIDQGENLFVYTFNGGDQLIEVPAGKNVMRAKLWGAGGSNDYGTLGGVGGHAYASFDVAEGMRFMLVVGESSYRKSTNPYGFAGKAHGHQFNGGGMAGIFVGNTPVAAGDTARAVIIAGGGGAGRESYGGEKRAGGPGGNPAYSGGMPTMQGQEGSGPSAYTGSGGGGGGYAGGSDWGRAGYGGTSFITAGPVANLGDGDVVLRGGDPNGTAHSAHGSAAVPANSDADYSAPAGEAAKPSGNPANPAEANGHGLIVLSFDYVAP